MIKRTGLNSMTLRRLLIALVLAIPVSTTWALDAVVFSNLNQPDSLPQLGQPVSNPIRSALAIPFTTDATNTELTLVRLFIERASASDLINVSIWDVDNSGVTPAPGNRLANLIGPNDPDPSGSDYVSSTTIPVIPITLQPSTSYFVVIRNNLAGSVAATQTRAGIGSDLSPPKYILGIPGVSPTTTCRRANMSWDCNSTFFSRSLFPTLEIVAGPPAPALIYSLTANPRSYDFGPIPLNTESAPQAFTVENDGTAPQTLGQLSISQGFLIKSNACNNQTLAPGATCSVSAAFAPTVGGQATGVLTIPADPADPAVQYGILLSGQSPAQFSVSGTLGGLATGGTVVISNIATQQTLTLDGPFSFSSQNNGATYNVVVDQDPTGQTCTVANGTGVISAADVTNVQVDCVDNLYAVGGLVSGLVPGDVLVLQNNGQDDLTLTADGVFSFPQGVNFQDTYSVTVKTQPTAPSETCTVTNGSGVMAASNITNVSVTCTVNAFSVGGDLSGLAAGESLELLLNGAHQTTLSADGSFQFTPIADATAYSVTVAQQPAGQTCTVSNGSGTLAGSDVTNVAVICVLNRYTIGGNLSGLAGGKSLVLANNGGDDLALSADGAFVFATPLTSGSTYSVAIKTQPVGETCVATNSSGTVQTADINRVSITCNVNTYRVAGNLSGLASGQSVELLLNGTLNSVLTGNGFFQFPAIADGSAYAVTVATQPTGQTCTVSNGTGTLAGASVNDVLVTCVTERYTIGGLLSGLVPGDTVVLQNNGGDDLVLTADGAFSFVTPVEFNGAYAVTVLAQPPAPSETCTVTNGSGTTPAANVNTVTVVCTLNSFVVGGAVSGLASGQTVLLQNNGADDRVMSANGNFVFSPQADATNYTVTVASQPSGQTCSVVDGSGTLAGANISSVSVVCQDNSVLPGRPAPIPTLSTWMLGLLVASIIGLGFALHREKSAWY